MPKLAEQPEFDFDNNLPAGKEWFSLRFLSRHWGKSIQHIINLDDAGEFPNSVDMRGKGAKRADTIVPRPDVVSFLNRRKKTT